MRHLRMFFLIVSFGLIFSAFNPIIQRYVSVCQYENTKIFALRNFIIMHWVKPLFIKVSMSI